MSNTDKFNVKFQKFERIIKEKAGASDTTKFYDALATVSRKNIYLNANKGLIDDLYALRNVFSHRERGRYVAEVYDFALSELESIIASVENPPTAKDKFGCEVYQAKGSDLIENIMDTMESNMYTHVPIWDDEELRGVFSYSSFFSWLHRERTRTDRPIFIKKQANDINRQFLNSPVVNYKFINENMDVNEIPELFNHETRRKKRLDCLLLTAEGNQDRNITGIVTPWDLGNIIGF